MSDYSLFDIKGKAKEIHGHEVKLEKELQTLIEDNMEEFFGIRFLATEYEIPNGRIDSIGIDENNCPVIIEYKKSKDQQVVTQSLSYLNWYIDHPSDFRELVQKKLNDNKIIVSEEEPRILCVASNFTGREVDAVCAVARTSKINIDLIRYVTYGNDMILFEQLFSSLHGKSKKNDKKTDNILNGDNKEDYFTMFTKKKNKLSSELDQLCDELIDYISGLESDISIQYFKTYCAFKKTRNFACLELNTKTLVLFLRINPSDVELEKGFSLDMRNKGHHSTCDLRVNITDHASFERAKPLIDKAINL